MARAGWAQQVAGDTGFLACLPTAPDVLAVAGTIEGYVTDKDGAGIAGARVGLVRVGDAEADSKSLTTISGQDGGFAFAQMTPGPFTLSISATGFAVRQGSSELRAGEGCALSTIALSAASTISVEVTATQTEIAEAQINEEEKQRVIGVFPNFYVSYISNPVPLDAKQKLELALKTLIDPVNLLLTGVGAGVQQAANDYDWGQGAQGYAKRYAASYGTFLTGTIIGNAALPILLKQDPRYFWKGSGSIHARVFYAVANAVICKGDNHRWQPNYSSVLGGIGAAGISNFYYPKVNRSGATLTFENAGIGIGISALSNLLQEFLIHRLTPHLPPAPPANP